MKKLPVVLLAILLLLPGCTKHEIQTKSEVELKPIKVEPIHITIDVNIRVDRALDNFFGDLDKKAETIQPGAEAK